MHGMKATPPTQQTQPFNPPPPPPPQISESTTETPIHVRSDVRIIIDDYVSPVL
jgi:hypothetical protein